LAAINLKMFAQFALLFFKAQIAQTQNALKMRNTNCATLKKDLKHSSNYVQYAQTPNFVFC